MYEGMKISKTHINNNYIIAKRRNFVVSNCSNEKIIADNVYKAILPTLQYENIN